MISIIAAIGKNRELGKDNKLLWQIPSDMKRFRDLTTGSVVIMGRKTYESLPQKFRPLPDRVNVIITRDNSYFAPGAVVVNSMEAAIEEAKKTNKVIFIIGGAQIYSLGIKYAEKLYLTQVDKEYPEADAFFPDYTDFSKTVSEQEYQSGKLKFKFIELVK